MKNADWLDVAAWPILDRESGSGLEIRTANQHSRLHLHIQEN
jgi:hypothetical protein